MKLINSPNPILLQRAEEWNFDSDIGADAVEQQMVEIMQAHGGIGLAGNQVGLLKRVFTIKLQDNDTPLAMFNPRVISASEHVHLAEEGCLSFPELWLDVKRPCTIDSEYFDKSGNKCTITLTGIDARCFLHELDHLDGKVFTQQVSPMKLLLAQKKQLKRKRNGRTK
jgi:peptide deformylase